MDEADAAGAVARGVDDAPGRAGEVEGFAAVEQVVGGGDGDGLADEGGEVERGIGVPVGFGAVGVDGQPAEDGNRFVDAGDVVGVAVGQQEGLGAEFLTSDVIEHGAGVEAAVDEPAGGACGGAAGGDDKAVRLVVAEGEGLDVRRGGVSGGGVVGLGVRGGHILILKGVRPDQMKRAE